MSVAMTSMILDCYEPGGSQRMLAVCIGDACPDASGESIYKSIPTLAHLSGLDPRTVQRLLRKMQDDSWLIAQGSQDGGRGRSTVYKISPQWIADVAAERARAAAAGERYPQRVPSRKTPPQGGDPTPTAWPLKGGNLSPFKHAKPVDKSDNHNCERVTNEGLKGDKKRVKGDIAMSPEHRTRELNTPLPPVGGGVENLKAKPKPQPAAMPVDGLGPVADAYPRKDPADADACERVWRRLQPTPECQAAMLAAIADQLTQAQWQRESGRFVPRLSRWLRGWKGWSPQAQSQDGWASSPQSVRAEAARLGLPDFETAAVDASASGGQLQWSGYVQRVAEAASCMGAAL